MHLSFTGEEESAKARTVMNSTTVFPVADRPRKDDQGGESQKKGSDRPCLARSNWLDVVRTSYLTASLILVPLRWWGNFIPPST